MVKPREQDTDGPAARPRDTEVVHLASVLRYAGKTLIEKATCRLLRSPFRNQLPLNPAPLFGNLTVAVAPPDRSEIQLASMSWSSRSMFRPACSMRSRK